MDVGNIAELNTFLLLDAIRSHGEATRRELGRELGLSDASVSRIVKRLLASGIIEELPGSAAVRGRTPSILRFIGPAGAVIAVDLGGTRCHGALADLAGGALATDFRHLGGGGAGDSDDAVGTLLRCIAALRSRAAELAMPVRAVVVGIPALIDPVSQLATAGPNVRWQGFDLLAILGDELAEPFEVDNDPARDGHLHAGQRRPGAPRRPRPHHPPGGLAPDAAQSLAVLLQAAGGGQIPPAALDTANQNNQVSNDGEQVDQTAITPHP
jgi:hypothetical protein